MSFKREGDDGSQLNLLKKRRVAELLSHHIPDDEAVLMSSGRYACTVCHYRPVFDTVDMLTVHRAGKKHLHAIDHHFAKKRELALLVQKRRQESELKRAPSAQSTREDEPAPLLQKVEEAKRHALLKEAPYNPCHKYRKDGPSTKPKAKLFFQGVRQMQLNSMRHQPTNQIQLNLNPSNQHRDRPTSSNQQEAQKSITETRIKSFKQASDPGVSSIQLKPYIPKAMRSNASKTTGSNKGTGQKSNRQQLAPTSLPSEHSLTSEAVMHKHCGEEVVGSSIQYISEYDSGEFVTPAVVKSKSNVNHRESYAKDRVDLNSRMIDDGQKSKKEDNRVDIAKAQTYQSQDEREGAIDPTSCDYRDRNSVSKNSLSDGQNERLKEFRVESSSGHLGKSVLRLNKHAKGRAKKEKSKSKREPEISAERRQEIQRYLELTSSGWVQDAGGQWVKGQDVEFDSDEEAPA